MKSQTLKEWLEDFKEVATFVHDNGMKNVPLDKVLNRTEFINCLKNSHYKIRSWQAYHQIFLDENGE